VNGVCVSEEEVEKEFPWLAIALIGGGTLVAAAALAKRKKTPAKHEVRKKV